MVNCFRIHINDPQKLLASAMVSYWALRVRCAAHWAVICVWTVAGPHVSMQCHGWGVSGGVRSVANDLLTVAEDERSGVAAS